MSTGTHCPACSKDIGILPIMTAPTPTRISCPHCKARMHYEKSTALTAALFAPALLLGGLLYYVHTQSLDLPEMQHVALLTSIGIAFWSVVELSIAVYLRKCKKLLLHKA